jgi:hypothetical protein
MGQWLPMVLLRRAGRSAFLSLEGIGRSSNGTVAVMDGMCAHRENVCEAHGLAFVFLCVMCTHPLPSCTQACICF